MTILCLCQEEDDYKLIPGYAAAFRRRGIDFVCVDPDLPFDTPLDEIVSRCKAMPAAILHFESSCRLFPTGIEKSSIPTICFHADTYAYTRRRIRWSAVFDQAAVFHPGYVRRFSEDGHPGAFLLPHAARREFCSGPELDRQFEVGWVGQTSGAFYNARSKWLPALRQGFQTNEWSRRYTIQETANVYRRSRIVVNIGRDDFPQDANLRVFEAMACGALLITQTPTELTDLSFQEGVHFVGYREPSEIKELVRRYLNNDTAAKSIAAAGRELTLSQHTYEQRVETLLARIDQTSARNQAPARSWPEWRAGLIPLDFYAASGLKECMNKQYKYIARRNIIGMIAGTPIVARAWLRARFP
jgi:glycosyltransferase involved in cell wall biosynthesis